jgi:sortase A
VICCRPDFDMRLGQNPRLLRIVERGLWIAGGAFLAIWLLSALDARLYEVRQNRLLEDALTRSRPAAEARPARAAPSAPALPRVLPGEGPAEEEPEARAEPAASEEEPLPSYDPLALDAADAPEGALIGRIEIPRAGVSALLLRGTSSRTLRRGVGTIRGTAPPGAEGNVGLAGHRDSFFRGLRNVREDDTITLKTLGGDFRYRVEWTRVVAPHETAVLAEAGGPVLTLVTCYPFSWIGPAPERFIVRARRIDPIGSTEAGGDAEVAALDGADREETP